MMDLPAPVSPVTTFRPGPGASATSRATAKPVTVSCSITVVHGAAELYLEPLGEVSEEGRGRVEEGEAS